MPYYTKMAHFEVVDISCVQCLVARVADSVAQKRWALVDRSGNTPRSGPRSDPSGDSMNIKRNVFIINVTNGSDQINSAGRLDLV